MLRKIEYPPVDVTGRKNVFYYESFPIKPGVYFFKALARSKLPFSLLRGVKIPDTLCFFEELAWIKYDYTTGDLSIVKDDVPQRSFYESILETDKSVYNHYDLEIDI